MATNEKMGISLDLRGLDIVTSTDLISQGRTPFAKNFRLYAKQSDDRQVAVSSRKGPGYLVNPISETLLDSQTGAATGTVSIGVTKNIAAQKIVASAAGRLNKVDIRLSNPNSGSGPIIISIYSDDAGRPSKLLTQSSIPGGTVSNTPQWLSARFLNAPKLASGEVVWMVIEIQDDGKNAYEVDVVNGPATGQYSDASFAALQPVSWAMNFRAYYTMDEKFKGGFRFNREDGANITVAAYGTTLYALNPSTKVWDTIVTGLNPLATYYSFTRADGRVFWVNGYDDLKCWNGTTVETITDTELPILSFIKFHKDRLFGVVANDKNKFIWSEAPGNPSNNPPNKQWYREYLSTSFWYVPAPKTGSPITGLISFQDSLVVFTQDSKWIFTGYDNGSFNLVESTGSKGALHFRSITKDENFIYFVSNDGIYEFNGSKDTNITEQRLQPLFDACERKEFITPIAWNNKVRFYMSTSTSLVNDICILFNRGLGGEWEMDTDTYIDFAITYDDADDNNELVEFSSQYGIAFLGEVGYNSLGAPIDFEYRFKYDSFGVPAQKKRMRRYYPIFQGVDSTFNVRVGMDKDMQNSPIMKDVTLAVNGSQWGTFDWADGTTWGGDTSFKHHRQSYSGSAYYWQLRVSRKGVDNRVAFVGSQYKYRLKRM